MKVQLRKVSVYIIPGVCVRQCCLFTSCTLLVTHFNSMLLPAREQPQDPYTISSLCLKNCQMFSLTVVDEEFKILS